MKQRTKCILKNLALTFIPALVVVVCMALWITYVSPAILSSFVNPCADHLGTCSINTPYQNTYSQAGLISPSVLVGYILIVIGGYATYRWAIKPCLVKEEKNGR